MATKRRKPAAKRPDREFVVYQFTKDGTRKTLHKCSSKREADGLKAELAKKYTANVYGVFERVLEGPLVNRFRPKKK